MGPGDKSHATKTRDAFRRRFGGKDKAILREECVTYLKIAGAKRPLVLGMGIDAEMCRAAGMEPIVVDNGSIIPHKTPDRRRKVASYKKAFITYCEMNGFDWRWGPVEKFAHECDSAILDFCSHLSPAIERAVAACTHMVAVTVTLMPERLAVGSLSERGWKTIYREYLREFTGLVPTRVRLYVRNKRGTRAMVVMLRRTWHGIVVPRTPAAQRLDAREAYDPETARRKRQSWLSVESNREKSHAAVKRWREAHPEYQPAWAAANREKGRASTAKWQAANPEALLAYQREYEKRPEVIAMRREYRSRPENKARSRLAARAWQARKRAMKVAT